MTPQCLVMPRHAPALSLQCPCPVSVMRCERATFIYYPLSDWPTTYITWLRYLGTHSADLYLCLQKQQEERSALLALFRRFAIPAQLRTDALRGRAVAADLLHQVGQSCQACA